MPSSEDSGTPRFNPWTLEEFGDLVTAWELAASRPRDAHRQNLDDAVYKHFVALRGGSTRRNKAALTSKRSALKFSYLFIQDYNMEYKSTKQPTFFELPASTRGNVISNWKKVNSSVVDITPVMFQALGRIVSKGIDEEAAVGMRRRQKELQEAKARSEMRPTRGSNSNSTSSSVAGKTTGKRKQPTVARATSNPWSSEEMRQLITAWGTAAENVCESKSDEPMSIVHEMYKQFEILQGGRSLRNLSGLATRRRVLKQSYSRISAFDKIQEMNGDPVFADLPVTQRQNALRSWKNANLLDLSKEMYAQLHKVILLDTRAVALEDIRRTKAASASAAVARGRKPGRPSKKQKTVDSIQDGKVDDDGTGSVFSSQPASVVDDSEEEKASIPMMVIQSREVEVYRGEKAANPVAKASYVKEKAPASIPRRTEDISTRQTSSLSVDSDRSSMMVSKPGVDEKYRDKKLLGDANQSATVPRQELVTQRPPLPGVGQDHGAEKSVACSHQRQNADEAIPPAINTPTPDRSAEKSLLPKPPINPVSATTADKPVVSKASAHVETPKIVATPTNTSNEPGKWIKRKRKVHPDGPNGHLWGNEELTMLIKAWEKAAILVCNSDPAEQLSLNREMYREFVELQGGSSVRNSTALAARRSSLKFSYVHIQSFNESQKAKGEPSYHEIPEDTRMTLLRSWKNRNSVDLSMEMFDGLRRIFAMDEKLAEIRSLRPPPRPHKPKKKVKSPKEHKDSKSGSDVSKTAKWPTEESSDLIKACADIMNAPTDKEQSATERESLIYDAFVARRKSAGDADAPIRRDLRAMAQQWRYILASYSYIKACNDNRSEDDTSWFDMSPVQKRAYQQCTNVPVKFVDLDAEMFELVTKTSFVGAVVPPLPSPAVKSTSEGISLRPRATRKRTEAFWSSDSESSVSSMPVASEKGGGKTDSAVAVVKKGNNWPDQEIWNLIQAWEEALGLTKSNKLTSALNETFALFTKLQEGPSNKNRTINSVRNKMIALKSSFAGISTFIAERGDSSAWFDLTPEERLVEIRGWNNKTIMDLNKEMFDAMARILHKKTSDSFGNRKAGKTKSSSKDKHDHDSKGHAGQKPEKYIAANWSKEEVLMLGEACGELLEGRRSRRYVFEEEKDRFYRRYEELGGTNSSGAAVGLARFVLDSYEFIYFYNLKAADTNCLAWFELDLEDRDRIVARMSKAYRSFNGLTTVDENVFDIIDGIDAEIRVKLGETKKKTYKPPNDATSSRYVDIEAVVERCTFIKRKHPAPKKPMAREVPVQLEVESSDGDADSELSSSDESSGSVRVVINSQVIAQPEDEDEDAQDRLPRRDIVRRGSDGIRARSKTTSRKRTRDADVDVEGSATLYITEIIQRQNRKLEEAVKRFRKDSANARKEHHDFLLRKIQDSFPVDSGNGSFLERVAERQGQTLVQIFQRLQQQRDVEKAKDDELMRHLFGRRGRA